MAFTEEFFTNSRGQKVTKAIVTPDVIRSSAIDGLSQQFLTSLEFLGMQPIRQSEHVGYAAPLQDKDSYVMQDGRAIARHKAYLKRYREQNENIDIVISFLNGIIEKLHKQKKANNKEITRTERILHKYRRPAQ